MVVAVLHLQTLLPSLTIASGERGPRAWSCGAKCDANINQGAVAAVESLQTEHKMGRETVMWGIPEEEGKCWSALSAQKLGA